MNRIEADLVKLCATVRGDAAGQAGDRGFRGAVRAERRLAADAGHRRHVDDRTVGPLLHRFEAIVTAEEVAVGIDLLDFLPQLQRGRLDGAVGEDRGVVDENVDARSEEQTSELQSLMRTS